MNSLVITPRTSTEMKFLEQLLLKLGISTKVLSEEEREDLGLSLLMKAVDRHKKVSRETIMKKLGK